MPALELSISHIATALSACVRMDDQVAAGQPSTASTPASPTSTPGDEWDATGSALVVSDLADAAAPVDSKTMTENNIRDLQPVSAVDDDHDDIASTHSAIEATGSSDGENNSTDQNNDSGDVVEDNSQIPAGSYPSSPEVQREEFDFKSSQHGSLGPPSLPSQQLEVFKQQLQQIESRDQQLMHLVGRNNRELLRQQDEQQRQLEEKFEMQQRALTELTVGFRSQQQGRCVCDSAYMCDIVIYWGQRGVNIY